MGAAAEIVAVGDGAEAGRRFGRKAACIVKRLGRDELLTAAGANLLRENVAQRIVSIAGREGVAIVTPFTVTPRRVAVRTRPAESREVSGNSVVTLDSSVSLVFQRPSHVAV